MENYFFSSIASRSILGFSLLRAKSFHKVMEEFSFRKHLPLRQFPLILLIKKEKEADMMRRELLALRDAMARRGVDVYVVPTADFHGSEYVGDYFRCRAYVSGFTGSAGTLAVSQDWAGLWTDGRYFLQAAEQLKDSGIALCKMEQPGVPTLEEWLEAELKAGMTLGFDGRTMSAGEGERLRDVAEKAGAQLCCELDLVGEIWEDRPPLSSASAWELDEKYTGCSRRTKLNTLKQEVKDPGADTFILTSLDDLAWLLNIRGSDVACCPVVLSSLLLDENGIRLYADQQKFSLELKEKLEADGITFRPYFDLYEDVRHIPENSTVLLDPQKVNFSVLQSLPKSVKTLRKSNPTERKKAVKNPTECENMRLAHIKDGVALTRFMKWLKETVKTATVSELSAAEKLEEFRRQMTHYQGPSFDPIMGYGPHGAIIHYSATEESCAALKPEGFLLSDTGGHYLEGSTDVTRTFVLGPLTREMRHDYTTVLRGHLNLAGAVFKAGIGGAGLDILARAPFWSQGLDFNHGTGHGVGYLLSVHEGPQRIRYGCHADTPLEPGMITSNEPGLYLEGKYGIRLENLELCIKKEETEYGVFLGFEPLTMCPFELDAICAEELSEREKKLLNDYHETVYQTLSPWLDDAERAWLRSAARAI